MKPALRQLAVLVKALASPWTWLMAWRDSRTSRRRLLLFSTSIVLGIAALVAIGSFGHNVQQAVADQAKSLLGADLVLTSRQEFTEEQKELFKKLGGEQAIEISFSSMIYFPNTGGTRLVQVRAVESGFPFYGELETKPPAAAKDYQQNAAALVEQSLLTQFEAAIGDPVRVGELTLPVGGSLEKVPGETVVFATIAPRVYIPFSRLADTQLLRPESLARYKLYLKFGPEVRVPDLISEIRPELEEYRLSWDTVEKRKENLGRAMENLYHFLGLVGFIALLLGGVGIASAIHVHIKQKLGTVAVLRCLGSPGPQAFSIYLAQAMALGLIGVMLGGALGLLLQLSLPRVLADFLPMKLAVSFSPLMLLQGIGIGFVACVLFALLPLLAIRRVSPLAVMRGAVETETNSRRDPILWALYLLIGLSVLGFALTQTQKWRHGFGFFLALIFAFGLLMLTAKLVMALARRLISPRWPYVLRQGLANLHRPNNRTSLLLLSLGLGTFLILTLHLTQDTLLKRLFPGEGSHLGNAVLFDIQSDQRDAVKAVLRQRQLPVLQEAPIVTMRIASVNGRPVADLLRDKNRSTPRWVLRREYRSTYRDRLVESEELTAGRWHERVENSDDPVPISLEEGIADDLKVQLGDLIEFDVQGVPMTTRVASLRKVEWRRLQPNFFVVFPQGVLEEAPSFHVFVTRVNSPAESAAMQKEMVQKFPNVSAIDMTLVLQTVESVLGKIAFAIQFMALFTAGTGLVVLISSILTGRYQRIQESILLRTLGASRRQIFTILLVEYFCLGLLAACTGAMLSVAASWALAEFLFKVEFVLAFPSVLIVFTTVSLLTVLVGLLTSRGILNHPPLEILRAEG
ncbi:MAG: FtsX-like permease family protein [Verrucomicrobiota bacterium]